MTVNHHFYGEPMSGIKTVVIHQVRDSMTNLEDTIEHFRPDYLFLITCEHNKRDKPDFALMEIQRKNHKILGKDVINIEYSELIGIEEAWHNTTMMEVFRVLGEIKKTCEELAGNNRIEYYAGLADGTSLITVGISFAAVLHGMKTYFTRGRRSYYHEEYVIEIENLNKITEIQNWLNSKNRTIENLHYLRAILELEEKGVKEISSAKLTEMLAPRTRKAVDNAMNILIAKELIEKGRNLDGEFVSDKDVLRNRIFKTTHLGKLIVYLNPSGIEKDD